ncbi:MAG: hypothetical protein DLM58_04740 [Pseudonocardiales bacterium]|nr:MAG: hypothetical protein DLM58_04740 [Pseudonocardiales bacterium]
MLTHPHTRTARPRRRAAMLIPCLAATLWVGLTQTSALASGAPLGHGPNPAPAGSPLPHTHAHNDYLHDHPLFDALSHRFDSVESDIWLADDGALVADPLLIGHTKSALQHGRRLQDLYLDPLLSLVNTNRNRHVYAGSTAQVTLLVDVKSDAASTYRVLDTLLRSAKYIPLLTVWTKTGPNTWTETTGPLRVIISGNRDQAFMLSQPTRRAAYDGRLSDVGGGLPASFMPWISNSWSSVFSWHGTGPMPADQRARLHQIVTAVHATLGQQLRFYGTPDRSTQQYLSVWQEELAAGVDWLNTDELAALEAFLTSNP